jgi:eukaryotic-like serine/threonine-protein kinase
MLETLAHYKILGRIGVGRMGELFRARDTRAGRTVALRVVTDEITGDPDRRRRFLKEARLAATLSHPNIAAVYEIGDGQDQRLFLVSEFVPGDTLRTLIAGRALNPRSALDHGIQLADALAEGHAAGILHQDIQPQNIIITPKGNAKFIDFGLGAWTASGAERQRIASVAGDNAGSADAVAYMAPEHVLGRPVDQRADVFSLGAVLFEMFAGTPPPLVAPAPNALTAEVLQTPPPPPSTLNRTLPRELDVIVLKMLARSIDDRYGAAATVAAELRSVAALLDAREGAAEPIPITVTAGRRERGPWILIVLAAIAVLAAALAFFLR